MRFDFPLLLAVFAVAVGARAQNVPYADKEDER